MIIPKEDPIFITLCFILFILIICSVFGNKTTKPYIEKETKENNNDVKKKIYRNTYLNSNNISSIYN